MSLLVLAGICQMGQETGAAGIMTGRGHTCAGRICRADFLKVEKEGSLRRELVIVEPIDVSGLKEDLKINRGKRGG